MQIEPARFIEEWEAELHTSALLIDVREQEEWDYYHVEPAMLIPLGTLPDRTRELPRDKPLFVICAHGVRSAMACRFLRHQGFTDVTDVLGGMAAVSGCKGFQYD